MHERALLVASGVSEKQLAFLRLFRLGLCSSLHTLLFWAVALQWAAEEAPLLRTGPTALWAERG